MSLIIIQKEMKDHNCISLLVYKHSMQTVVYVYIRALKIGVVSSVMRSIIQFKDIHNCWC